MLPVDGVPEAFAPPLPPIEGEPGNEGEGDVKPSNVKIDLPVDEDDYLQPKSTNPAAYMDLIDGKGKMD